MKAYTPNPTQVFPRSSLEDMNVESMADTMARSRHTRQSSSDDGDLRSTEIRTGLWRIGREDEVHEPLDDLVDESEWVEEWVLHIL